MIHRRDYSLRVIYAFRGDFSCIHIRYALHPGKYFYIEYMNIEYANIGRFYEIKLLVWRKKFFFFQVVLLEIHVILFHLVSRIF